MKRAITLILVTLMVVFCLTGCGNKLSGTYKSENGLYSIEFKSNGECTWYQDGSFFEGTYKVKDDSFQLDIQGNGFYSNTVFTAVEDDKNTLIINGGIVNAEKFIKQ